MEILLYSEITSEIAANTIQNLGWCCGENQVQVIRMFCPGGNVQASWGIAAKMNEIKAKGNRIIIKVDGMAASMGGALLCWGDEREVLDVSQIMLHKGVYGSNEDGTPYKPTKDEKEQLNVINGHIMAKLLQIIDNNKFQEIKGYTIEDLFDENKPRIDCYLTPQEAFEVGLATKVVPLDANNYKNQIKAVAACYKAKTTASININNNKSTMTVDELKKQDPACFDACKEQIIKDYQAELKTSPEAVAALGIVVAAAPAPVVEAAATAKPTQAQIDQAVEAKLKELGLEKIEGKTLVQVAQDTAKIIVEKETSDASTKTALDELEKQIAAVSTGKKVE